jgi:glycerol-3-phosphate dehydrogenase
VRRTRALVLNAAAAVRMAPVAARLLAEALGRDQAWADAQVADFLAVAKGYSVG